MSDYVLSTNLAEPFAATLERVREALAEVGFGVITEIDLAATLKGKLGVEIPPQLVLGACRPELAHRAIRAEPSVAALLPCNVVVRSLGEGSTVVEMLDPAFLVEPAGHDEVRAVAADARDRLVRMVDILTKEKSHAAR